MDSTVRMGNAFIRIAQGLLVALAGVLAAPQAALANIPGVSASIEPLNPSADFYGNEAVLKLRLLNSGPKPTVVAVETVRLAHKNGLAMAGIKFADDAGNNVQGGITLPGAPASGQPAAVGIKIQVSGMRYVGTYQGNMEIVALDAPGQRIQLPLEVVRQAPGFDVAVSGSFLANGVMTVKPQSAQDKSFTFRVENPTTAPDVEILVEIGSLPSGKNGRLKVAVSPPRFTLMPGGGREVTLNIEKEREVGPLQRVADWIFESIRADASTLPNTAAPLQGAFTGSLNIVHAQAPGLQKSLQLIVQPSYMSRSDTYRLFGLVLLGTMFSVLVGTIVPTMIARQRAWARVRELNQQILKCTEKGTSLQIALLTHLNRLDYQLHDIWWFSTRAEERLKELATQTDTLEESVKLIDKVHFLYERVRMPGPIPVSVTPVILRYLGEAVDKVIEGNILLAQAAFDKASAKETDTQLISNVQKSLEKHIARILVTTENMKFEPGMANRRAVLAQRQPELTSPMSEDDILVLDQDCFALHLYVERYLRGIMMLRQPQSGYGKMNDLLVEELASGVPGIWRAVEEIESMAIGVLQADIDDALRNGKAEIVVTPSNPSYEQLVEISFRFTEGRLNHSPLMRRLQLKWSFGDGYVESGGLRCLHFYKKNKKILTLRKNAGEREAPKVQGVFKVTVEVTAQGQTDAPYTFNKNVAVKGQSNKLEWLARAEVVSTVVVFLGAAALAYMTHLGDIRPLENIQDYFNPILWGFGLDQMKSLVTRMKPATAAPAAA